MPDQTPSFEHATLEADLKALAAEIRNQRDRPELTNAGEKEVVKEAIRAFPARREALPYGGGVGSAPAPAVPTSPLPLYAQAAGPEVRLEIEYLLDIALHKGIGPALAESEKSPYFVQDAFHDALAGKLYPELQKRGVVK